MRVTCERKVWQRFNLIDAFQNDPKNKGYLPKTSVTTFSIQHFLHNSTANALKNELYSQGTGTWRSTRRTKIRGDTDSQDLGNQVSGSSHFSPVSLYAVAGNNNDLGHFDSDCYCWGNLCFRRMRKFMARHRWRKAIRAVRSLLHRKLFYFYFANGWNHCKTFKIWKSHFKMQK